MMRSVPADILELFGKVRSMSDGDAQEYFDHFGHPPEKPWDRQKVVVGDMCRGGAEAFGEDSYMLLLRFLGDLSRRCSGSVKDWILGPVKNMPGDDGCIISRSMSVCERYAEEVLGPDSFLDCAVPTLPALGAAWLESDRRTMFFLRDLYTTRGPRGPRLCAAWVACVANLKATATITHPSPSACVWSDSVMLSPVTCYLPEGDAPEFFATLAKWSSLALGAQLAAYVPPEAAMSGESDDMHISRRRQDIVNQIMTAFATIKDAIRQKRELEAEEKPKKEPAKKKRRRSAKAGGGK